MQHPEGLDDESEVDEGEEHEVEFFESGEDAPESFQSSKEPLYLVSFLIHRLVVEPRFQPVALGRHHRNPAEIQRQLPGFVVLVRPIHDQMQRCWKRADGTQQLASAAGIGGLARREREAYSRPSIRGNQMNLGGPASARLAKRLGSVFLARRGRPDAP